MHQFHASPLLHLAVDLKVPQETPCEPLVEGWSKEGVLIYDGRFVGLLLGSAIMPSS